MKDAVRREQANTEAGTFEPGLRVPFSARGRLVKLIAAKLLLDLLFVCGLALYTHAVTYRTGFRGEVEQADGLRVSGWVEDLGETGAPVELQLFLNGHFASTLVVTDSAQGRRAFVFRFEQPRYGEFEARVYAVREGRGGTRRTLQQLGDPRRFEWK
jgi:hypothetical protein